MPLCSDLRHLDAFHHQCLRIILKILTEEQKCTRLTSAQLRSRFGDEKSVAEKVRSRQLEWLGHVARMPDNRMPKCLLFAALPAVRPACRHDFGGRTWLIDIFRQPVMQKIGSSLLWIADVGERRL